VELANSWHSPYIITVMPRLQSMDELKAKNCDDDFLSLKTRRCHCGNPEHIFPKHCTTSSSPRLSETCHRGFYTPESSGVKGGGNKGSCPSVNIRKGTFRKYQSLHRPDTSTGSLITTPRPPPHEQRISQFRVDSTGLGYG
jgi:hypothetical protein